MDSYACDRYAICYDLVAPLSCSLKEVGQNYFEEEEGEVVVVVEVEVVVVIPAEVVGEMPAEVAVETLVEVVVNGVDFAIQRVEKRQKEGQIVKPHM